VFVTYLVLFDLAPLTRQRIWVARDGSGVSGVAYFGRQLALACELSAVEAFSEHAKRQRGERMIFGPRDRVRAFWQYVQSWHMRPRIVRERQHVMMLDRQRLRLAPGPVTVRHARREDASAVTHASAELIEQELAYDPRRASRDFAHNVAQMIEHRLWWVAEKDGRICFFCNIGPWCRQTAQLQGIWTPPELRGQGLATAALSAICDRLLEDSPTLSLYVNDFNVPAIALYRRLGFEIVGEYQTMLF